MRQSVIYIICEFHFRRRYKSQRGSMVCSSDKGELITKVQVD